MLFFDYRGWTIYPVPRLIGGSGRWKVGMIVRQHTQTRSYSYDEEFTTEGEAVFNCIKYGKKLIDEGVKLLDEAV